MTICIQGQERQSEIMSDTGKNRMRLVSTGEYVRHEGKKAVGSSGGLLLEIVGIIGIFYN